MGRTISEPHDPYITLDGSHFPPYVELLVRANIAEKHPRNSALLRLVAFHK